MTLENCKILNRDQIKLLAVVTMTLNHFAHVFLTPGTVLCEVLQDIGYFTAMTMCFFLVEGYRYTRSRRDYARRLLAFAILSQVPYVLALGLYQLNVLFTLLICFLILCLMDSAMAPWKRRLSIFGLFLVSCACDWSFMLPMGAVLLKRGEGQPRRQVLAYAAVAGIFWLLNIPGYMDAGVGSALLPAAPAPSMYPSPQLLRHTGDCRLRGGGAGFLQRQALPAAGAPQQVVLLHLLPRPHHIHVASPHGAPAGGVNRTNPARRSSGLRAGGLFWGRIYRRRIRAPPS